MTTDQTAEPLRIPIAHSVHYAARGLPEVPNQHGPGALAPCEITLTYRAASDSQLGRVHAYVAGRIWVDGKELPLLPGGLYGQHYFDGLDGWPEWLVEEARLHDPAVVPVPPPADRAALRTAVVEAVDRVFDAWAQGLGATRPQDAITAAVLAAVLPEPTDQAAEVAHLRTMYDAVSTRERELINERDELRTAWETLARWNAEDAAALIKLGRLVGVAPTGDRTVSVHTAVEAIGTALRRMAAEEQPAPCVECGHPKAVHRDGDDPVTPGECSACPEDDARHDHQPKTPGA